MEQVWRYGTRLYKTVTGPHVSTTKRGGVVQKPMGQQFRTHGLHSVSDTGHGGCACDGDVEPGEESDAVARHVA